MHILIVFALSVVKVATTKEGNQQKGGIGKRKKKRRRADPSRSSQVHQIREGDAENRVFDCFL
jgi:hypothetical protein